MGLGAALGDGAGRDTTSALIVPLPIEIESVAEDRAAVGTHSFRLVNGASDQAAAGGRLAPRRSGHPLLGRRSARPRALRGGPCSMNRTTGGGCEVAGGLGILGEWLYS
jgi:hypothetical protein